MLLDHPNDPDRQVGEIFRRLSSLREACGEAALTRCVAAVLVTLGASAMAEAEIRARALTEPTGPRPRDVRVTAWAQRTTADPFDRASSRAKNGAQGTQDPAQRIDAGDGNGSHDQGTSPALVGCSATHRCTNT